MKYRGFYLILGGEALVCLLLLVARESLPLVFTALLAFPWEQVGLGLRLLSLTGPVGNGVAVVLYLAICLLPAASLVWLRRRRELRWEDGLLLILSAVLLAAVYLMINPGLVGSWLGAAAAQGMGLSLLGGTVYALLIGYGVLRLRRALFAAEGRMLNKYLYALLCAMNVFFVFMIFGLCASQLLDSLAAMREANSGRLDQLGLSYSFLVLQFIVNALPYFMDVLVVFAGLELLAELNRDRFGAGAVAAAERLAHRCGLALLVTVVANLGFNLLQLTVMRSLAVVSTLVHLPLPALAFAAAALLLARYIRENKQLKDDNDMFI